MQPKVIIDLVPIVPGRGGSGGGIWTYARALLRELDEIARPGEVLVLVNRSQPRDYRVLETRLVPTELESDLARVAWTHVVLPAILLRHRGAVLHKIATEAPLWGPNPLVTTIHDFMNEYYLEHGLVADRPRDRLSSWYFRTMAKLAVRRSVTVIAPTESVGAELRERFARSADKVQVIHEATALPPIPERPEQARAVSDRLRLLYVAGFHRHKGHERCLAFLDAACRRRPDLSRRLELTFHGHVADRAYFDRTMQAASLAQFPVAHSPYDLDRSLADVYAAHDVLVSFSEYEGFGLPILEAQAFGLPVCCADLPVFREVAGDSALVLDLSRIEDAIDRFAALLDDEALRASYRERGRRNLERFSWRTTAARTLEVYRGVTSTDPRVP